MAQTFDDEILSVVLRFSSPNKRDMEDVDKLVSHLSANVDTAMRRALAAGKPVNDLFSSIKKIEPVLRQLEKRAGSLGMSSATLQTAQKILARYTPERIDKMAEAAASRVAETSGTAALRRELEKHGELTKRLIATQESRYNRATGSSPVGRGLFLDTETTGLDALKHQVVELTATLFTFNKKTGEIINEAERTYHGFQQLAFQSRHQYLPTGITASSLQGQGISSARLTSLINKADFVVAHNAPFDKKFVEKLVPAAASAMWLDTMRGIPWRQLGYRSRAQQDLIRAHSISPGTAHRTEGDVASGIKLLASRSPLGGGTYLSRLLGNQGPLNNSQQTLAVLKSMAEDIRKGFQEQLGEGRGFDPLSVRYSAVVKNYASRAADSVAELFSQYVLAKVEGQLTSRTRGYSQEPTPSQIGPAAIAIDRKIGVVDEFLRNMAVMSGPMASQNLLEIYTRNQEYQEKNQRALGRGKPNKQEIRPGSEVAVAAMSGVNTYLSNRRLGVPSGNYLDTLFDELEKRRSDEIKSEVRSMLTQPWAQPARVFDEKEVADFISKYKKSPSVEAIQFSAQMAKQVGENDPRYLDLSKILLAGQKVGRQAVAQRALEAQQAYVRGRVEEPSKSKFRDIAGEVLRGMSNITGNERGSVSLGPLFEFAQWLKGKFSRTSATQEQARRVLSFDEQARGPISEPLGLRASMRYDALQQKLKRLQDVVEGAAKALEQYETVVSSARAKEATAKFQARGEDIDRVLASQKASIASQLFTLQGRGTTTGIRASRRISDIQSRFEETSAKSVSDELEAERKYNDALRKVEDAKRRIAKRFDKSDFSRIPYTERAPIEERLNAALQTPQLNLIMAKYRRESSQLYEQDPALQALRERTASEVARARFGVGSGPVQYMGEQHNLEDLREEVRQRTLKTLSLSTPAEKAKVKIGNVVEDQDRANKEIAQKQDQLRSREGLAEEKANQQRLRNAKKFSGELVKIEETVEKKRTEFDKKVAQAEEKSHAAKVKYLKDEAARGGAGGSSGSSEGGGGGERPAAGGLFGGGLSRSGYGLGIGLAGLSAFDAEIKNVIKDSAEYAAKVQLMGFSTEQMAKVAGLNTDEVNAEVQAIKKMNITTEEANSVVQKMMMTQQDLAKSTDLVRVAQDLAAISGQDAMQVTDRLMNAVVTGYTRNLHMMGLQVTMTGTMRELNAKRKAEGKQGPPTMVEQREALVGQILEQGNRISGTYEKSLTTAGGQFAYLRKEALEASNVLGQEFLPQFGRVVNLMTAGLQFVQKNGDAFAHLASILAGVGVAAQTLGSIAFVRWMIGAGAMSPQMKLLTGGLAVATGLVTTGILSGNKGTALNANEETELNRIKGQIGDSTAEVAKIKNSFNKAVDDQRKDLENQLNQEQSFISSRYKLIEDIERDHTAQLVALYNERLKAQQDFYNKNDSLLKDIAKGPSIPFPSTVEMTKFSDAKGVVNKLKALNDILNHPAMKPLFRQGFDSSGAQNPGRTPAEKAQIEALAKEQRDKASEEKGLPRELINKDARTEQILRAELENIQTKEATLDTKEFGSGEEILKRKFERGMQTPRERIQSEYEQAAYPLEHVEEYIKAAQDLAAKHPVTKEHPENQGYADLVQDYIKAKGVKDTELKGLGEERDSALSRMTRLRQADIIGIRSQVDEEKIRAAVIKGNYESEAQAIQKLYALKLDVAAKVAKKTDDYDQKEKDVETAKAAREVALAQQEQRRQEGILARKEVGILDQSKLAQEQIIGKPGLTSAEAINRALDEEIASIHKLSDSEAVLNKEQEARIAARERLRDLASEEAEAAVGRNVDQMKRNADLQMQIQRTIASQKPSGTLELATGDIEAQRQNEVAKAQAEFQARKDFLATPEGVHSLNGKPLASAIKEAEESEKDAINAANVAAVSAMVNAVNDQINTTRSRLLDGIKQAGSMAEQALTGSATSKAEEIANIENVHKLKLQYIQQEYDLAVDKDSALAEAKSATAEVEFQKYQQMVDLQKQQVEDIKNFADQMFQTIMTDHARGLRDMLLGQVRGVAGKIFGNIVAEEFKNVRLSLPKNLLQMQDPNNPNKTIPTKLGRILSGTVFGTPVDSQADIDKQLKIAVDAAKESEDANTQALKDLTELLKNQQYSTYPTAPGVLGGIMIGGKVVLPGATAGAIKSAAETNISLRDLVPLFGGNGGSSTSVIFHARPGSAAVSMPTGFSSLTMPSFGLPFISTSTPSGGSYGYSSLAPLMNLQAGNEAATNSRALSMMLSTSKFVGAKSTAQGQGLLGLELGHGGTGGGNNPFVLFGMPQSGGSGSTGSGLGGLHLPSGISNKAFGVANIGFGAYQAATNAGKGARGDIFAVGGGLQTAAGIAALIPGGQAVAVGLEAAALLTDVIGGLFQDPRQARANYLANYLAANQYLAPTQLAMTYSQRGNLVSEGKGGGAQDSGISAFPVSMTQSRLVGYDPNASPFFSLSGKPNVITNGRILSDFIPSNDQYTYEQIPGQVSYSNLSANAQPINYGMTLNINAMDSASILARSSDIALAVQKELNMGNGLSVSMQNAIFGH